MERARERVRENVLCSGGKRKEQRGDEPGDRVARNNKEQENEMYERIRGKSGSSERKEWRTNRGTGTTGREMVRLLKSRFFRPRCRSQKPPIYRSMFNKATSARVGYKFRVTIRALSDAITSSLLPAPLTPRIRLFLPPCCFYIVHQVFFRKENHRITKPSRTK